MSQNQNDSLRKMDTPLDFLRNWLPLGRRDDDTTAAAALRNWLDSMAGAPPEDIAASLAQRIGPMLAEHGNLHMGVRLLDTFHEIADELLPPLEKEITFGPLPFASALQKRAVSADNLLKALSAGYATIVAQIESRRLGSGLAPLVQHALQRAIIVLRRRQLLAYRAYAAPSPTSWQHLHDLFRTAHRLDVLGSPRSGLPIEQLYVSSLLVAYADPGKFARPELDALADSAERAAALVRIRSPEAMHELRAGTPLFIVNPGETGPGRPMARAPATKGLADRIYLDCNELAATIRSDIGAKTRLDTQHAWLLPNAGLSMLRTLATMWGAQPTRRFSRMRFKPRADLVAGLFDVTLFLAGGAFRRRRDDPEKRGPNVPAISEWALVDESPDGFGIRYLKGDIGPVEVGDVVALRPRESSKVQICLVRRVSNAGHARFEIGLQNLSPHALVVDLPGRNGGVRPKAILLPRMPAFSNAAGLLALPGTVPDGLEIRYPTGGGNVTLRLAQRLEGNPQNDFFLFTPAN